MSSEGENYHSESGGGYWLCWIPIGQPSFNFCTNYLGHVFGRLLVNPPLWECRPRWVRCPSAILEFTAEITRIDLDIEGGGSTSYATFVNKIRSLSSGASKKWVLSHSLLLIWPDLGSRYYVTAAPQCVFPDGALGGVLNSAVFDAIYGKLSNML